MSTIEGSLDVEGRKLYTKTWKADGTAKARLAFIHGYSDHCNAQGPFFPTLASKGIEVHTFDQAGWGRSVLKPSDKGLTGPTSRVISDISAFLQSLLPSPVPLFLMGHSMGGAQVLVYAAQGPADVRQHIRGYIVEAPLIGLDPASQPSSIIVAVGRVVAKVLPQKQKVSKVKAEYITRDEAYNQSFIDDELCHETGTLEGLAGMLDRAAALDAGHLKVGEGRGQGGKTRMLVAHGTADRVTAFDATKKFCEKEKKNISDFEFKVYDGWYHKLHAEPKPYCDAFANDVVEWISQRSDDGSAPESDLSSRSKL